MAKDARELHDERLSLKSRFGKEAFWRTARANNGPTDVACFFDEDVADGTYKDEAGCYHHRVDLAAMKPFSLETLIIPCGPYAGLKAVVLAHSNHFPFKKLPPKLREMAYGYVLRTNGTINISTISKTSRFVSRLKLVAAFGAKLHSEERPRALSLLLVDRATSNEAQEFLYKKQHFVFAAMGDMTVFMERISKAKDFLTKITVDRSGTLIAAKCYRQLIGAQSLQRFSICLSVNFKSTLQAHVDKHYEALGIYLLAHGADEAESLTRLEKITFTVGASQSGVTNVSGKPIRPITPEMNGSCRRQIRGLLRKHFMKEETLGTKHSVMVRRLE